MHLRLCAALYVLCLATPALAGDPPYYGPMKPWHGIGYKFGYEDRREPDGSWRVDAASRHRNATEIALYRAAERARAEGYPYVEMLGGFATEGPGRSTARLYARPSRSPAAPAACWKKTPARGCYTADVGDVLRRLGGPDGTQPGVALSSGIDKYGRQVSYGGVDFGFGVGAAHPVPAAPVPVASLTTPRSAPVPVALALVRRSPAGAGRALPSREDMAAERFAQALKESQPVARRSARGDWTISD